MRYQELLVEYKDLLAAYVHLQQELRSIPKGYLVAKKISGREYQYLQYSVQGEKKSEYVREEDAERIRAAIARREPAKAELDAVRQSQDRLERAARILDTNLYRTFVFLNSRRKWMRCPLTSVRMLCPLPKQ